MEGFWEGEVAIIPNSLGLFKIKVKRCGLHTHSPFRLYVFNNYHIPGGGLYFKYKDIVTGF